MTRHDDGTQLLLRGVAVAIAVLAVVDPAVRLKRHDRSVVAVTAGAGDSARAARVRAALARDFDVVPGALPGASAMVVVGDAIPPVWDEFDGPAFAVRASPRAPRIVIERMETPARLAPGALARVGVHLHALGAKGRVVQVTLHAGDVAVDRVDVPVTDDDARMRTTLEAPALAESPLVVRAEAAIAGVDDATTHADGALLVDRRPARILFYDARASWMATFVRRAAERDARIAPASRVMTSTGVSAASGAPPPRLDGTSLRDAFDVVVVGAPDALAARDVAALDAFLRRRGGAVVVLLDMPESGAWATLANVGRLGSRDAGAAVPVRPAAPLAVRDSIVLRATELAWPAPIPTAAEVLAAAGPAEPMLWAAPVGAGRIVVSGALDAWRYRDADQGAFDRFWPDLLVNEAARAVPAVDVRVTPQVARPGDRMSVAVTLRDAALSVTRGEAGGRSDVVEGWLHSRTGAKHPVRLIPDGAPGRLVAEVIAPDAPGAYLVVVRSAAGADSIAVAVRADAKAPNGTPGDALSAWVASRGGQVITEDALGTLAGAVAAATRAEPRVIVAYPMRSPWWIVPFALLLATEWLLRRRRGLA